jgi:hypothetical protein
VRGAGRGLLAGAGFGSDGGAGRSDGCEPDGAVGTEGVGARLAGCSSGAPGEIVGVETPEAVTGS